MADEYDDDEERRLRRLLGAYGYPDEGTYQQRRADDYPLSQDEEEENARNEYVPVRPARGRQAFGEPAGPLTPADPESYREQLGAPTAELPGPGGREGAMPIPSQEPGFEAGGGEFQEPAAAAPPQFNPQAEVARMTAPPPPPIRVYAHTPGGLQEISQVEGSQGQPVSGGGDPVAMGSAGQALLNREQQIRSDPQLSPAERSRALAHIHQLAGQLALQSAIHGHGAPAQAMEGQFSTPQQQQLARLDAAEDQANQKFASGEYKPESYWPVMAQIAEQRQAIKSKAIPKGPSPQEAFDMARVTTPDGRTFIPKYHTNGTLSGYEAVDNKHEKMIDSLLKQNPHDSLHDILLHVASAEAEMRGQPGHPNLPRLHGPATKGGEGALAADTYEPPDQLKVRQQAIKELEAEHTSISSTGTKVVTPYTPRELELKVNDLNYAHHKWYDDVKAQRAAKLAGQGGAAPGGQPAPPPQPGVRQQLGDISNQAFKARDDNAFRATAELLEIQKKYPAGLPMIRDPAERAAVIERLKAIKRYYPTLNIPEK